MGGFGRSLKYAAFRSGRLIGITLLMSVVFVFYFLFLDGDAFSVQNIISRFPFIIVFVGNLMYMLYGMVDVATYTQYTMSCGSTRREVMFSMIFMQLLQIAVSEAVMLLFFLMPEDWQIAGRNETCTLALLVFLAGSGVALIMGILIRRFGRVAYIILVIICSLGGGIMGGLIGISGGSVFLFQILSGLRGLSVLAAAGVVWYVIAVVIFWFGIRKIEVRV